MRKPGRRIPSSVIVTAAKSRFKTLADVVNAARSAPGTITYGSPGNGTTIHLAGEALNGAANIKLVHVPYKGTSPAMLDAISGTLDLALSSVPPALGQIKAGKLRALAVPVLDLVLGAPGVIEMINQGTPTITRAVISSAITKVPSAEDAPVELKATYRGWDKVAFRGVEATEEDGSFILVRSGLWSWKLAEVELRR